MLLDSNIIIYAIKPEYENVRDFIAENPVAVSAISYLEVLGYHLISEREKALLEGFFSLIEVIPISSEIISKAKELKQIRKMSLGDSIIAATAIVRNDILVTHNTEDFKWIDELKIKDIIL